MAQNLVVIPTYNEKDNIAQLVQQVIKLPEGFDVLIVDDNSPDGTGALAERLAQDNKCVFVIHRKGKMGLGTAYREGFAFALREGFEHVIEMDADFSHDPRYLPEFIKKFKEGYDVVIGSRYITGGGISNWAQNRKALSKYANMYARFSTRLPVMDTTGGFNGFKRQVLEAIDINTLRSNGYAFQIEVKYRAWKKGFRLVEFPIVFSERTRGYSKIGKGIIWEALWGVWRLRLGR
ncbi:MAG: polyprenol monophosphomannose synthase [bacterium]